MKWVLLGLLTIALIGCQNQNSEAAVKQIETTKVTACSKDIKVCPDGQKVGRDMNNECKFFDCPAPAKVSGCPDDVKQCADGSFVSRNQSKFCEFNPCPEDRAKAEESDQTAKESLGVKACSKELKACPNGNGRSVGRNPLNNCEFHTCESLAVIKGESMLCTQDVKQCADGSFVGRDANKSCAFKPCPEADKL